MHNKTLSQLSEALHNGDISSVELTQHYLDLIRRHNAELNAFITINEDNAIKQAQTADRQLRKKQRAS